MRNECRLPCAKRSYSQAVIGSTTLLSIARVFSLSSLLLTLSFLTSCGSAQPQPLIFGEPVWADGETSVYRVTNREDRIVGTAAFQVNRREQDDGWTLIREINDAGASEQATVEMQPVGYRPVYSHLVRTFGGGKQEVETQFEGAQVDIALTNRQGATVYQRVQVPSDIRDERTLLLIMRALPLAQGYATRINSFLPIAGQMERVALQVRRKENVTVPAGSFDTWVVELKANDRTTRAWVAQTAPFTVVKFVDGRSQATFELTGFE
ncbi:MAG: DUF3108 domain-containing protein [Caldilineaceae bacterium SB0665_bin_25]|nr:DUF3108 domain-containing protein [Caldilineaceae bacterium SB0665_bin_25]